MERKPAKACDYVVKVKIQTLEEGGFLATCPDLPGCRAEGETIPKVIEYIDDVARIFIELMTEEGLPIPDAIKSSKRKKTFRSELLVTVK